jgi:cytochrome c peroxidase
MQSLLVRAGAAGARRACRPPAQVARRWLGDAPKADKPLKAAKEGASAGAGAASGGGSSAPLLLAAAAAAAGGYYYYTTQVAAVDVAAVKKDIAAVLDNAAHDDGSYGPILVRLAWHNAGTFDKAAGTGGSEGAGMRFAPEKEWGANAGLATARAVLEPIKAKYSSLSYSDLWALAGNVAIEEMGGPALPFKLGRKDKAPDAPKLPDGLLPDADGRDKKNGNEGDHLRDIFYRMGFNDQEIVALSGAHSLGRCHPTSSGFWGPWTRAPTTFSNQYFVLLLSEKWTPKKKHEGKPWTGPAQFEDKTGELMMLPTDLALIKDAKLKPWVEKYAADEKLFFSDFAKAWTKLQENGCKTLQA